MQTEKTTNTSTPDAPGVYFNGETKSGFARYEVLTPYHAEVNQDTLTAFFNWKQCAKPTKLVGILLPFVMQNVVDGDNLDPDDKSEVAMFFSFLAKMANHDFNRVEERLDDLIESLD